MCKKSTINTDELRTRVIDFMQMEEMKKFKEKVRGARGSFKKEQKMKG